MLPSDDSRHTYMYVIDLGDAYGAQVCFNDGNGNWDSLNAANYKLSTGTYGIVYTQIYRYSDVVMN